MEDKARAFSQYRLDKAKDDLEAAKLLLDAGKLKQSVNRSYYSIFHSARAVLALDCFDSKKHSGVIAFFNQHYIATKKFESILSKILMQAQKIRNNSDYDDFYLVSFKEAEEQYNNAVVFIQAIDTYLQNIENLN